MAKQKGHRANKPNDSFGTVNDSNLYRGKYREEVYEEETDAETSVEDPEEEPEATPHAEISFASPSQENESDYKKRYDDLKRHYDSKLDEWKKEKQSILDTQTTSTNASLNSSQLPKTPEELEEFKSKYPDVYAIVETVSSLKAESKLDTLKKEVADLKGKEQDLHVQSAYKELVNAHPDFVQLKKDSSFLEWLDNQPTSISDGIYKNNLDAQWGIRF